MKKITPAIAIVFAVGFTGVASAGMQGQGGKPDAQKPEYKEAHPGGYRDHFTKMDRDNDGFMTREDLVGPHAKELSAQWDKMDKNKDGKLDETEFGGYESDSGTGASASDRSPEAPSGASEGESAQQKQ